MSPLIRVLRDEAETVALGDALADTLLGLEDEIARSGVGIGLRGDLGAGKTTLVRALLRRAGVTGRVKSPTFSLLELYDVSRLHFHHFDFYRLKTPQEFVDGGFSEWFGPRSVCLVEWPERAGPFLPRLDWEIGLELLDSGRRAVIRADTPMGETCQHRLTEILARTT